MPLDALAFDQCPRAVADDCDRLLRVDERANECHFLAIDARGIGVEHAYRMEQCVKFFGRALVKATSAWKKA